MRRYLLFFSYNGTNFQGLAKQKTASKTVHGLLEQCVDILKPSNAFHLVSSSRTDRGVNALCNASHIDLQCSHEGYEYDAELVTRALNSRLHFLKEDVRILKTLRVSKNFHCRSKATGRTYVYRICCAKHMPRKHYSDAPPMVFDEKYFYNIRYPLDIEKLHAAANILEGEHNFTAFSNASLIKPHQNPVKNMKVTVKPANSFLGEYNDLHTEHFQYWDFIFTANSFLNRQVRKMCAVMLAAGRGDLSLDNIRHMLEQPDDYVDQNMGNIYSVLPPGHGLFLIRVHYNEKDFEIPEEEANENVKLYNPFKELEGHGSLVMKLVGKGSELGKFYNEDIFDTDSILYKRVFQKIKETNPSSDSDDIS